MSPPPGSHDGLQAALASSPTQSDAGPTFPRFSDLPCEIRLRIWSECIPGQLIIVNRDSVITTFPQALRSQRCPPVISQVCQEARVVALDHGSQIILGKWSSDRNILEETLRIFYVHTSLSVENLLGRIEKAWFNPKRDTLVLHRPSGFTDYFNWAFQTGPALRGSGYILADDWTEHLKASNRIAFYTLGGYARIGLKDSPPCLVSASKEDRDSRMYITKTSPLHASLPDAIETGLFGLFGEKRTIIVDFNDTEIFKRLARIAKCPRDLPVKSLAFSFIPNPQTYDSEVEMLKQLYLLSVLKAEEHR